MDDDDLEQPSEYEKPSDRRSPRSTRSPHIVAISFMPALHEIDTGSCSSDTDIRASLGPPEQRNKCCMKNGVLERPHLSFST
jgi:hypothetical protein